MAHGFRVRLAALAMLMLALSGCAGGEKAPQVAAGGESKAAEADLGRKFAGCMRAEGVDMPDPGADGMVGLPGIPAGDTAAGDKIQRATEKCREFLPDGGEPPKLSAEDMAKARDYAKCVRENGIPGFPDPDPETGGFKVDADVMKDMPALPAKCQQFGAGVTPALEVGE